MRQHGLTFQKALSWELQMSLKTFVDVFQFLVNSHNNYSLHEDRHVCLHSSPALLAKSVSEGNVLRTAAVHSSEAHVLEAIHFLRKSDGF
jgi:hypothetical protein